MILPYSAGRALGRYILLTWVLLAGCSGSEAHRLNQPIIGVPVRTTVDSPAAAALAQDLAQGRAPRTAPAWREPLDAATMQRATQVHGLDWATLVLLQRLYEGHQEINQRYRALLNDDTAAFGPSPYRFLFVPGFLYEADTTTGADMARQRELMTGLGYDVALVPVRENGLIEKNAEIIADTVRRASADRPLVLVSASKGGLETAVALGSKLDDAAAEKVAAWISIGGILRGTYLADHARDWPRSWLARVVGWIEGFDYQLVADVSVATNRARFDRLTFPKHLLMIQYVGVPLSGQISEDVKSRYRELSAYGPNDGLTTVLDELVPGGHVILDVGLDHYYRDPEIDRKTVALVKLIDGLSHNAATNQARTD